MIPDEERQKNSKRIFYIILTSYFLPRYILWHDEKKIKRIFVVFGICLLDRQST